MIEFNFKETENKFKRNQIYILFHKYFELNFDLVSEKWVLWKEFEKETNVYLYFVCNWNVTYFHWNK